jgi:uncharacterized protein DUF4232
MDRRMLVGLSALLLVVSGCGTQSAAGSRPDPKPYNTPLPSKRPTPTPTPPPATCPANGAKLSVGVVDAALGHRAVTVKLTNCSARPMTLDGYPDVAVLDAKRNKLKVAVARDSSYMAIDPGPVRIRLAHGESALAAVSWSSTVEMGAAKLTGTYLSIASGNGDRPVIWPVVTDIGTTAKISLTAWCLKFPA